MNEIGVLRIKKKKKMDIRQTTKQSLLKWTFFGQFTYRKKTTTFFPSKGGRATLVEASQLVHHLRWSIPG